MKKTVSLLLVLLLLVTAVSFSAAEEKTIVRLGGLTGPTAMGMAGLLKNNEAGTAKNAYDFTLAGTADELTPLFIKGELDMISVPVNLGSVLYNKLEGEVTMLCVNTLGVLYILEKGGETVHSAQDLKGKTVFATGKGATPEFTLRCLLKNNGLDPDTDVNIIYKSEPAEIVAEAEVQENAVFMLPQPYVIAALGKLEGTRIALDITEEWAKVSETSLITSGVFVRTAFLQEHPEAVARFMDDFSESVSYVNASPAEAAVIIGNYGIVKQAVAEKAIPYCHIVCVTGEEMQSSAEAWLGILLNEKVASVGGALPGKGFYYLP